LGKLIVFDMDGVLVDVTESYRETVVETVRHFSGRTISRESIQDYKNSGGWNNDWLLTQRILRDFGTEVDYDTVVREFNHYFLGHNGTEGLVNRERWIARPGTLERLAESHDLAIFTGRMRYELDITIGRFGGGLRFDPVICADDVAAAKPDPEGLLKIKALRPGVETWYAGDTVDDARSAKAAGVRFIGIVAPDQLRRAETAELLRGEGAEAVLSDINELVARHSPLATGL
jgi:HAD superfamily hydrolase (TIGR01548 family)